MRKLLHIEQVKLLNYNPFRITLGIYFLAFTLGLLIYPVLVVSKMLDKWLLIITSS